MTLRLQCDNRYCHGQAVEYSSLDDMPSAGGPDDPVSKWKPTETEPVSGPMGIMAPKGWTNIRANVTVDGPDEDGNMTMCTASFVCCSPACALQAVSDWYVEPHDHDMPSAGG